MAERSWEPVQLPAASPRPAGAYSAAVRAGNLLFVSGQVPKDPTSGEIRGDTVAEQTRLVFDNVARVLAGAGATLADVVSVTAYLADIDDWAEFNEAYQSVFAPPYPSRTTVGAGLHGFRVEVSVIAVLR